MAPEGVYNMNEIGLFIVPKQDTKHKEKFMGAKFKRTISLLL